MNTELRCCLKSPVKILILYQILAGDKTNVRFILFHRSSELHILLIINTRHDILGKTSASHDN